MSRIESLTPDQEAKKAEYVRKWTDIGLSVRHIDDKPSAADTREAVDLLYKCGGLTPPEHIIMCESPYECKTKAKELAGIDSPDFIYGQHDASWLAFYDYMLRVLNIKECGKIAGMARMAELFSWSIPCERAIFISLKPVEIHLDQQGRLSREGGMAIRWSDDKGVYAWRGTRLTAEWGKLPHNQWKEEWLLTERNADLRRALIQALGYSRIVAKLNGTSIHKSGDMELIRFDNVDVEPMVVLKVVCPSTQSIYALRVPPDSVDCETARQRTFRTEGGGVNFEQET